MLNYYQPYLLPFLGTKLYSLPNGINRYYYHSMEDGLWEFIRQKKIPKGAVFLLPDFYCVDVLNNIKNHGFIYKQWKMDKDFNTNINDLIKLIQKTKPKIMFIFHPAGITSNVLSDTKWINYIPEDCYIIEDCVHRLINPAEIHLIHTRHVIMDSLRKVSPIPGSLVYGSTEILSYRQSPFRLSRYFLSSTILFIIFRIVLKIGCIFHSAQLTDFAHQKILQKHDDIIGDSWESYPGLPWVPIIHRFFNFKKVENMKKRQVHVYKKFMESVYGNKNDKNIFYEISIPESDYKNLHVYPVGLKIPESKSKQLVDYLHKHNISVWVKFPGCSWNNNQSCLFLPLGFHVSDEEIQYVVSNLNDFIASQK